MTTMASYTALEDALARLPTVDAVRIVATGDVIEEVHVLSHPGKTPKQVVRDVQSLAMAQFGVSIDRRVISVVQVATEGAPAGERPAIVEVTEAPIGARIQATVTLAWQSELLTGEAVGPSASVTRLRLVGEATVNALEQALGDDAALALAALEAPMVGAREVAVAQVVLVSGGEERLLVGSALVGADPAKAAVRAVLDALNRHIPQLRR